MLLLLVGQSTRVIARPDTGVISRPDTGTIKRPGGAS